MEECIPDCLTHQRQRRVSSCLVRVGQGSQRGCENGFTIHYWRTRAGVEVDFVLYGEHGLHAFEVKLTNKVRREDFKGLQSFLADYPMAKAYLIYCGEREMSEESIAVLPITDCARRLPELLTKT